MGEDELKQAIQRPLQQMYPDSGKRFEPALLDTLAADAAEDVAYLPLLQVTLEKLWADGWLKLSAYGTLTDAIRQRAEQVFTWHDFDRAQDHPRSPEEQALLLHLLLDLVEVAPHDETRRDVRRRRPLAVLQQDDPTHVRLIDALVRARLVSTSHEPGGAGEVVDIIHESLLTNWPRLHAAIANEQEALKQRARFEAALYEWQEHACADAYLLTGVRLSEAQALADRDDVALRSDAARALLKRSISRQEAAHQREVERQRQLTVAEQRRAVLLRRSLMIVAMLLVIALGTVWVAWDQRQAAHTEAARAEQKASESLSRSLAASARMIAAQNNPDQALALAVAAVRTDPTVPQAQAVLSDLAYAPGTRRRFETIFGAVAFSPDGQTFLRTTLYGMPEVSLELRHAASGKLLRRFAYHDGLPAYKKEFERLTHKVWSIAFTPDGRYALSGGCLQENRSTCVRGEILVWEIATGTVVRTFTDPPHDVRYVAVSPDGQHALSIGYESNGNDGTLRLWDITTGTAVRDVTDHRASGYGSKNLGVFTPDGQSLLSGACGAYDGNGYCTVGEMVLWDVATGEQVRVFSGGHGSSLRAIDLRADGELALSVDLTGTIQLWEVATGEQRESIEQPCQFQSQVDASFIDAGSEAILVSSEGRACMVDFRGDTIARFAAPHPPDEPRHQNCLNPSRAIDPEGHMVLLGAEACGHGSARLWDLVHGAAVRHFALPGTFYKVGFHPGMLFSPDGQYLLTDVRDPAPDQGNELVLWNVATGDEMRRMNLPTHSVRSMAFSPDGDTVIAGLHDGTVRLWDIRTGKEKVRFAEHIDHENSRHSIGIHPDGNTAISVSTSQGGESEIILWDIPTGEERYRMYEGEIIYSNDLAISSDGRTALIALNGSNPALVSTYWMAIDIEHGQVRYRSTKTAEHIGDITFSPDDQAVLYAVGKRIILWDLVNDKLLRQFEGHTDRVTSVAFHPDGTTIVSGACDGTVRLWDVAGGQEIRHFTGHATHILNVGFRADGKAVLSGAHDGIVRQWRIDTPEAMIAWTCTNRHVPELTAGQRIHYGIPDDLVLCPAQSLVRQARHQARAGNPEAAMETYTQALDLNPDLDFDAETELKRIPATVRWRQGDVLARHGDITGAIATFAAALALDPTLDFDAEARAVELAVPMLIHQSETLARNGNIDDAMAHFREVRMLLLDPDLEIEPQARAQELTALCWWGSLCGYADEAEVQDVCEQAAGLAPDHGAMRDSRGVHRALTGDVDGAIADFTAFVAWARENNVREAEAIIARREAWIAALEAGEHPFTEDTLNAFRNE